MSLNRGRRDKMNIRGKVNFCNLSKINTMSYIHTGYIYFGFISLSIHKNIRGRARTQLLLLQI